MSLHPLVASAAAIRRSLPKATLIKTRPPFVSYLPAELRAVPLWKMSWLGFDVSKPEKEMIFYITSVIYLI